MNQIKKIAALQEIRKKRADIYAIAEKYGVRDIRVFGSVARGEETPQSDVDLLVKLDDGRDYLDLGGFQYLSSIALHRHVDVVLDHCLHPAFAPIILKEAIAI